MSANRSLGIALFLIFAVGVTGILSSFFFHTEHYRVLIDTDDLNDRIIAEVWYGESENRVWCSEIAKTVLGENSYWEITLVTRGTETDRAIEFLDNLGVEYYFKKTDR